MGTFLICLFGCGIVATIFSLLHQIDMLEKERKELMYSKKLLVQAIVASENAYILNPLLENGRRKMIDVEKDKLFFNNKTGITTLKGLKNSEHQVEFYID
jgi:proline dehydrogenase